MDDDQQTTQTEEHGDTTGIPGAIDPAHPPANGAVLCLKARPARSTPLERKAQGSRSTS